MYPTCHHTMAVLLDVLDRASLRPFKRWSGLSFLTLQRASSLQQPVNNPFKRIPVISGTRMGFAQTFMTSMTTSHTDFGTFSFEEAIRVRRKYRDRIPVLVGKSPSTDAPNIPKHKYLVPMDLTVGQFQYVIRKQLKLGSEKALFVFIGNSIPPASSLMGAVYEESKDPETSFLFVTYSMENTFG